MSTLSQDIITEWKVANIYLDIQFLVWINILKEDWNVTQLLSFSCSVSQREKQDEGWRTISSATCHTARHLSHALVVCGSAMNPFHSHCKESKKTRATLFRPCPFSSPSLSSVSASVSHLTTFLGTGSRSFSPPSSVESRLYSGPCNLHWQRYWLYLTDWWMAKINKTFRGALRRSTTIHYN